MTEHEWMICSNPINMLDYITGLFKQSELESLFQPLQYESKSRKFRLLACAMARQIWYQLPTDIHRAAVEVAEMFADNNVKLSNLQEAWGGANKQNMPGYSGGWTREGLLATHAAAHDPLQHIMAQEVFFPTWSDAADIVRDILGNPFRRLEYLSLSWHTDTALVIARAAYEERPMLPDGILDADVLMILADAIEEDGCNNHRILGHLRGFDPCTCNPWGILTIEECKNKVPRKCDHCAHDTKGWIKTKHHFRGCWALDVILDNRYWKT